MSTTSCKTGTSWVFPLPLGRSKAVSLTVGRDVTVALSTKSLRKCFHIQKDASWAGDSPGISLETNGHVLSLVIDNWCDEIIIVPGPGTKAFSREIACPFIYKSTGFCWIVSLSPHTEKSWDTPSIMSPALKSVYIKKTGITRLIRGRVATYLYGLNLFWQCKRYNKFDSPGLEPASPRYKERRKKKFFLVPRT